MKPTLAVLMVVALAGCGLDMLTATAIGTKIEADSAQTSARALEYAKDVTGQMGPQQAIEAYKAEKGENPPSLEVLVREGYLAKMPMKPDGTPYGYDPQTGTLLESAPAAAAPAPRQAPFVPSDADKRNLEILQTAVANFGRDSGSFPASLDALTPGYLPFIPMTSAGKPFHYDLATGMVSFTAAPGAPAPRVAGPPAAGRAPAGAAGGPLGEALTGIAIQQDLNNMSTAGSSAASSRMRSGARGVQQDHSQRQNQVMDDLGL